MKGPNGENLRIKLDEVTEKEILPKSAIKAEGVDDDSWDEGDDQRANYVSIKDEGRANSVEWSINSSCDTTLHELLHLTGLVDEYEEKQRGYNYNPETWQFEDVDKNAEFKGYDCRKHYKDSIMSEHASLWKKATADRILMVDFCECKDQPICAKYMKARSALYEKYFSDGGEPRKGFEKEIEEFTKEQGSCPAGYEINPRFNNRTPVTREYNDKSRYFGWIMGIQLPDDLTNDQRANLIMVKKVIPRPESERVTLLEERHWNAMIFPGCLAKNKQYYKDSQNAYKTSLKNGGEGCTGER